jgi:hypothetical protein
VKVGLPILTRVTVDLLMPVYTLQTGQDKETTKYIKTPYFLSTLFFQNNHKILSPEVYALQKILLFS